MKIDLTPYISISHAMVTLLKPLVEIVIHDLASGRICFIAGELSKRQVGDLSLLDVENLTDEQSVDAMTYAKLNFDGRLIRSISIPLKGNERVQAVLCINCDVSVFHQMQNISQHFLSTSVDTQPENLFKKDWQERLHKVLHEQLSVRGWKFEEMTQKQKKIVLHHLFLEGAFNEKKAADYIAKKLNIGRATIFKYLKSWRKENEN